MNYMETRQKKQEVETRQKKQEQKVGSKIIVKEKHLVISDVLICRTR